MTKPSFVFAAVIAAGVSLSARAEFGGAKIKPGMYAAGDAALGGFVTDSAGGGSPVVNGSGTVMVVR